MLVIIPKKKRKPSSTSESSSSASKDSEHEELYDLIEAKVVKPSLFKNEGKQQPSGDCKEETKEITVIHHTTDGPPQMFDKENCLICMERTREIVFLPCCHFLTCPLCAPKLTICPICNKKLEKHLKIYWC